ncbi:hypothetical protein PF007_g32840, partial [Phytophthora fragariae]
MKRGFRARLGWCVGRCCCLFCGVLVRASAVGFVVKYLVANEMPGFDSRTAHSLCRIAFWAHSRPQHAFWRSGIASQASGRPPWTSRASCQHGRPTACGSRQLVGVIHESWRRLWWSERDGGWRDAERMKRGFRARLGWCVGRCCCLFCGVLVRASAVGLVVKYLVANEMPRVRFPDGAFSLPHR